MVWKIVNHFSQTDSPNQSTSAAEAQLKANTLEELTHTTCLFLTFGNTRLTNHTGIFYQFLTLVCTANNFTVQLLVP